MRKVLTLCLLAGIFAGMPVTALAEEAGEIRIPVSVLAEGSEPDPDAVYTVEVVPETKGAPMPAGSSGGICRLGMKSGSTVLGFSCKTPGEFDYTFRQIPGKNPDCVYEETSFRLRLSVTETAEEKCTASAVIFSQDGDECPNILFRNRWAEPAWVTLSATSALDDRAPEDGAFAFQLLSREGEVVFREKNQGSHVCFPALRFDKTGSFRYEMKEKARTGDGIVYDRAVYTVMVQVSRDADYEAQVTILRNGKPYEGVPAFLNYTSSESPQTGDPIGQYGAVMLLSGLSLCLLLRCKRKTSR